MSDGETVNGAVANATAFDLSEFSDLSAKQEEGFDVEITHPKTGEHIGAVIRVAGPDSKRVRTARAIVVNERIEQKIKKLSADRMEEESNRITAASIISWSGIQVAGKEFEYNKQNAFRLMTNYPFIREQLDAFVGDRANFIKS